MKVIGLTGRAAAGKNIVGEAFAALGCLVLDVDCLGHEVLEESQQQVLKVFGETVVRDGKVDRAALGSIVFSDPAKLKALEEITHPTMVATCKALIDKAVQEGREAVVINAALLYRMGLYTLCDYVVMVEASLLRRLLRSKKRENITVRKFFAREKAQQDIRRKLFPPSLPVFLLRNGSDTAVIHRQVAEYCATIGIGISSS